MLNNNLKGTFSEIIKDIWDKKMPVDVLLIASQQNISIIYESLDKNIVSSQHIENGSSTLLINKNLSNINKRFVIAHNLGHYFLHIKDSMGSVVKAKDFIDSYAIFDKELKYGSQEWEANEFAVELLMPSEIISNEYNQIKTEKVPELLIVPYLAAKLNIASNIVEKKLSNNNLLDKEQFLKRLVC